jgi:hypothetical protein
MKAVVTLLFLTFVGLAAWELSSSLSSDAVGMAVGVIFGILAGIPTALLVLAGGRRRGRGRQDAAQGRGYGYPAAYQHPPFANGANPPVIVITAPGPVAPNGMPSAQASGYPAYDAAALGGAPRSERRFKVVGESEEWIEEW